MNKEYILFDLDGTITDPKVGITKSVEYALNKFNIEVDNLDDLCKFIGPPLTESFIKFYNFSEEDAKKGVEYYREYFKETGIFENYVYEGFEDLLIKLKDNNKNLIVATSKPQVFAVKILEHFGLKKYFDFIAGSNLDGTRVNKNEVIEYAIEECNIKDLSKAIMVGDREHDIIGANKVGIDSIGVLYGFGNHDEFNNNGATYIVENISELSSLLV